MSFGLISHRYCRWLATTLVLVALALTSLGCKAAIPGTFAVTLDGAGDDRTVLARQTGDGSYVVVGLSESNPFLAKVNQTGRVVWSRTLDFEGQPLLVTETEAGGFVVAGLKRLPGTGGEPLTGELLLLETDPAGTELWRRALGAGLGVGAPAAADLTLDGGYIFAGTTQDSVNCQAVLVKTDSKGEGYPDRGPERNLAAED